VSDEPDVAGNLLQHIKEIADDFPGDPILAVLMSPTPPAPRRAHAPAPPRAKPRGNRAGRPRAVQAAREGSAVGSYKILRAYAVTLTPGKDGTARIDPEAALRFARAGNWSQTARPLGQQRAHLMGAMANLASRGHLDKREGVGNYWTWPPGHRAGRGVDPVVAGKSS